MICLCNSKGRPIEIPRFLNTDKNGILQIGKSGKNNNNRIKRFCGIMCGKKDAHSEAQRMNLVKKYTCLQERYKDYRIRYIFKELGCEAEYGKEEERLLKCYFIRYGELPPLNRNLPDKFYDMGDLACEEFECSY